MNTVTVKQFLDYALKRYGHAVHDRCKKELSAHGLGGEIDSNVAFGILSRARIDCQKLRPSPGVVRLTSRMAEDTLDVSVLR